MDLLKNIEEGVTRQEKKRKIKKKVHGCSYRRPARGSSKGENKLESDDLLWRPLKGAAKRRFVSNNSEMIKALNEHSRSAVLMNNVIGEFLTTIIWVSLVFLENTMKEFLTTSTPLLPSAYAWLMILTNGRQRR